MDVSVSFNIWDLVPEMKENFTHKKLIDLAIELVIGIPYKELADLIELIKEAKEIEENEK